MSAIGLMTNEIVRRKNIEEQNKQKEQDEMIKRQDDIVKEQDTRKYTSKSKISSAKRSYIFNNEENNEDILSNLKNYKKDKSEKNIIDVKSIIGKHYDKHIKSKIKEEKSRRASKFINNDFLNSDLKVISSFHDEIDKIEDIRNELDDKSSSSSTESFIEEDFDNNNWRKKLFKLKKTRVKKNILSRFGIDVNEDNFKEERVYIKFHNIIDSESDIEDYSYFDYLPKWYSFHPNSKIALYNRAIKDILITLSLIYFPIELIYFKTNQLFPFLAHVFIELGLILSYVILSLTGVYDPKKKQINYTFRYIIANIYSSSNVLFAVYEQISMIFNIFIVRLLSLIGFIDYHMFINVIIICKFMLLMNLNNWIQINPILEMINQLMVASDTKTSKRKGMNMNQNTSNQQYLILFYRILAVFRVVLYYLILIHISSCLWIFCYQVEANWYFNNNNWVESLRGYDETHQNIYITAFYFTLTTLLSVGYGDIRPYNHTERIFTSLFMSIGVLFYSFLVTLISSVVVRGASKKARFLEKKNILDDIAREHYVKDELYNRINTSIIHAVQSFKADKLNLVENLPSNLKDEVLSAIYRNIINNLIFFQNVDRNFILFTCQYLQTNLYEKHYRLVSADQRITEMYFILKGKIIITMPDEYDCYPLSCVINNEHYMHNFLENNTLLSPYNLITQSTTNEIYSLSKENYFTIKERFPSIIDCKFKEMEFKCTLIQELEIGAKAFYKLYGTIYGYKKFSMERLNNEICRELTADDPNFMIQYSKSSRKIINLTKNPLLIRKKTITIGQASIKKERRFNAKNLFNLVLNKDKNVNKFVKYVNKIQEKISIKKLINNKKEIKVKKAAKQLNCKKYKIVIDKKMKFMQEDDAELKSSPGRQSAIHSFNFNNLTNIDIVNDKENRGSILKNIHNSTLDFLEKYGNFNINKNNHNNKDNMKKDFRSNLKASFYEDKEVVVYHNNKMPIENILYQNKHLKEASNSEKNINNMILSGYNVDKPTTEYEHFQNNFTLNEQKKAKKENSIKKLTQKPANFTLIKPEKNKKNNLTLTENNSKKPNFMRKLLQNSSKYGYLKNRTDLKKEIKINQCDKMFLSLKEINSKAERINELDDAKDKLFRSYNNKFTNLQLFSMNSHNSGIKIKDNQAKKHITKGHNYRKSEVELISTVKAIGNKDKYHETKLSEQFMVGDIMQMCCESQENLIDEI